MTISVALCTYNGASYLAEQLESIARQSRRPDELIVCDDRSGDVTPDLVRAFAANAPFPVHLRVNDRMLGLAKNFEAAIAACGCEIIALSDQDDLWLPYKLEEMHQAFLTDPNTALVFSDAALIDPAGQPLGIGLTAAKRLEASIQSLPDCRAAFGALLASNFITGATLAFRATLKPVLLPIPDGPLLHDGWIALTAAAVGRIAYLDRPLIQYRQHPGQQTRALAEAAARQAGSRYRSHLAQLETLAARLSAQKAAVNPAFLEDTEPMLDAKIAHLRARASLPPRKWRRFPRLLRELLSGRYHCFSNGWRSAGRDLLQAGNGVGDGE